MSSNDTTRTVAELDRCEVAEARAALAILLPLVQIESASAVELRTLARAANRLATALDWADESSS